MRARCAILAAVAALTSVLLLGASRRGAGEGRTTTHARRRCANVRLGVSYAQTLEANAIKQSKAGHEEASIDEVKNALHLLNQVLPAAKSADASRRSSSPGCTQDSWDEARPEPEVRDHGRRVDSIRARSPEGVRYELHTESNIKKNLYELVDNEIRYPMCTELINLRGPVKVNGVPQGSSQLSVDISCTKPVNKVIVVVPRRTRSCGRRRRQATAVVKASDVVEVDLNGADVGRRHDADEPRRAAPAVGRFGHRPDRRRLAPRVLRRGDVAGARYTSPALGA